MRRKRVSHRYRRSGFTMVELLVVISVVLVLLSLSTVALRNAIGIARQRATQATILKIHGLVQQRLEAFNRAMDRTNLQPAIDKMKRDLGVAGAANLRIYEILVKKQIYQQRFPQSFSEQGILKSSPEYLSSAHNPNTESSALLYWLLTKSELFGIAPVDDSEFSSGEVRDTDGDGLLEFVDAWGRPLRYYRWPTHLFRPGSATVPPGVAGSSSPLTLTTIDRTYVTALWAGLPPAPSAPNELDPLSRDPDDPTGEIRRGALSSANPAGALTIIQNRFHTPDTYHAFLIVSAGPDNDLGMLEPYSPSPDTTTLNSTSPTLDAVPGQGRLAALANYNPIESNPINDNLTNRNR